MKRVVITGMGLVSPLGSTLAQVATALRAGTSGVQHIAEWDAVGGMATRLAALAVDEPSARRIPRQYRRGMGRQAVLASLAAQDAITHADLSTERVQSGRCGVSIGSTVGSPEALYAFYEHLVGKRTIQGLRSTQFLQLMGHTCAANVALLLGVTGRVLAPMSACASGAQSIGLAAEAIRYGLQDVMICGGADEAHFTAAATFDLVGGASRAYNDQPHESPRPFDADRDGLVVGEGAGVVVLESLEHARARGATICAELTGFATTSDGAHITQPHARSMEACMRTALDEAGLEPGDVHYINAHATATRIGDPVEAEATRAVFGDQVPVSSTKGQTGHTLGACGALEAIFCVLMMQQGFIAATRNLVQVDPECAGLDHVQTTRDQAIECAISSNFAFGGVNTSLILRHI